MVSGEWSIQWRALKLSPCSTDFMDSMQVSGIREKDITYTKAKIKAFKARVIPSQCDVNPRHRSKGKP
jgi:hypothetical protein